MFSANYIDLSNIDLNATEGISDVLTLLTFIVFKNTALCLKYAIWLVEIMKEYANTKFK